MAPTATHDWRRDFGVHERKPPSFFGSKSEIAATTTQAHVLRRAFDLLELDGILCAESAPLVYFKQVAKITPDLALEIRRRFWNHGGAPILVLISVQQIHVYSGMCRPTKDPQERLPSLIKTIDWISEGLREFLVSVESGEFFRQHATSFNPDGRIDRDLLNNLRDARRPGRNHPPRNCPADS